MRVAHLTDHRGLLIRPDNPGSLFTADSFVSLADFPLAWRFAADRHAGLDQPALARLRPLNSAAARMVAEDAALRCRESSGAAQAFRSDEAPAAVRRALMDLAIDAETPVVLSWNAATALVTDWSTFVSHWDDLCYPASDDVTIWPFSGEWTLCYRHYEVFQYRCDGARAASDRVPDSPA